MNNKNDLIWSISLIVIGISTFIIAGSNIIGFKLPDIVIRVLGIVDLIALPFLAYTTIKKVKKD